MDIFDYDFYINLSMHKCIETSDYSVTNNSFSYNYLVFVEKGNVLLTFDGRSISLTEHSIVYIARNVLYRLQVKDNQKCLFHIFRFERTCNPNDADIKKLSLECPIISQFFEKKDHVCYLIDCERIHITLYELAQEYDNVLIETNRIRNYLLSILFVKLARSFQLHGKPSSISYVSKAKSYIAENYSHELNIQMIADYIGISRSYLEIIFSRYSNRTITTHINTVRANRAAYLLSSTQMSITDIAFTVGYNNRQHFSRVFTERYSCSPQEYRKHYKLDY